MSEAGIPKYFELARERYSIFLKRREGFPKPWTKDEIFLNNRFCNVFREDDRTTKWLRQNIRDPLNDTIYINPEVILLAIVAFRWFNRIETWEAILGSNVDLENIFGDWDSDWIKGELIDHSKPPYVTGSYIIKTPNGKSKLDGVLWCIDEFKDLIATGKFKQITENPCTHEQAQRLLEQAPFLGRFMAYQIIADARYTQLLGNSTDILTWAQPGPGSTRGIGRIFYDDVDKFKYGSTKDEKEVIKLMNILREASTYEVYWPQKWPAWEMQTIQNWACETDKYIRCTQGGRMKRKYDARG